MAMYVYDLWIWGGLSWRMESLKSALSTQGDHLKPYPATTNKKQTTNRTKYASKRVSNLL